MKTTAVAYVHPYACVEQHSIPDEQFAILQNVANNHATFLDISIDLIRAEEAIDDMRKPAIERPILQHYLERLKNPDDIVKTLLLVSWESLITYTEPLGFIIPLAEILEVFKDSLQHGWTILISEHSHYSALESILHTIMDTHIQYVTQQQRFQASLS